MKRRTKQKLCDVLSHVIVWSVIVGLWAALLYVIGIMVVLIRA